MKKEGFDPFDKLKTVRQESVAFVNKGVRINKAFWYHATDPKYPNQIGIHVYAMKIGKTMYERKAAFELYKHGLDELAKRLEKDPELEHIDEVVGWSKLVYEHPNLARSLGFEVTERDEKKKEALAIMTRKEFLKRPWNKKVKRTEEPSKDEE